MDIKLIEQIGHLLCEGVILMRKLGVSHPVLEKSDEICKAAFPDLNNMSLADGARLAEAAYSAIKKAHSSISP